MIIALSGYAMSGKDTVADIIMKHFLGFKRKKYSSKLKSVASILTGIPEEQFESQLVKSSHLTGWGMTVREFLQRLGTDAVRDNLHRDAWVMALFSDYHSTDNWIITDCRFYNEYEYVKKFGGYVIRVHRPNNNAVNSHPSETALDDQEFDAYVYNDGSLEDLECQVLQVMKELLKIK